MSASKTLSYNEATNLWQSAGEIAERTLVTSTAVKPMKRIEPVKTAAVSH